MSEASDTAMTAMRALTKIEEHMLTCDRRYEDWQRRQADTITILKDITSKLSIMDNTIAEAKGAAKMGRALVTGVGAVTGFVGGLVGHIAIK